MLDSYMSLQLFLLYIISVQAICLRNNETVLADNKSRSAASRCRYLCSPGFKRKALIDVDDSLERAVRYLTTSKENVLISKFCCR
jgi:hypothetical protein